MCGDADRALYGRDIDRFTTPTLPLPFTDPHRAVLRAFSRSPKVSLLPLDGREGGSPTSSNCVAKMWARRSRMWDMAAPLSLGAQVSMWQHKRDQGIEGIDRRRRIAQRGGHKLADGPLWAPPIPEGPTDLRGKIMKEKDPMVAIKTTFGLGKKILIPPTPPAAVDLNPGWYSWHLYSRPPIRFMCIVSDK